MIPLIKPILGKDEEKAVLEVLRSGQIAQGKKVEELEKKFARFIGSKYAIAVSSGTAALHLALLGAGIGSGDEVITSPFSFIATANACLFVGAKPVFVDINKENLNIDPKKIEATITPKTKAIIPVHLFGAPADMVQIREIAEKHKLTVIEDACQAHGAAIGKKKVGSWGLAGCFSLYATKNMIAGEGGLITTNSKSLAEKCRLLRSHGMRKRYYHETLGFNLRMTDIEAAIALVQLKKIKHNNRQRVKNALFLNKLIKVKGIVTPKIKPQITHVFHQYTLRVTPKCHLDRNELIGVLRRKGISCEVYYLIPIYKQPFYKKIGYHLKLPVVEEVTKEVVSLPIHPSVSKNKLKKIARVINSIEK